MEHHEKNLKVGCSMTRQYEVSVRPAVPRPLAAVHARLPIRDVPGTFWQYLNQVYAAGKTGALRLDGQNVFLYRDGDGLGDAEVAFGVGVKNAFEKVGNVQPTLLPAGTVATTTHWGNYAGLGDAHAAVIEWCKEHGFRRAKGHPRWEVYGHWTDDESKLRTDVFYLLESAGPSR